MPNCILLGQTAHSPFKMVKIEGGRCLSSMEGIQDGVICQRAHLLSFLHMLLITLRASGLDHKNKCEIVSQHWWWAKAEHRSIVWPSIEILMSESSPGQGSLITPNMEVQSMGQSLAMALLQLEQGGHFESKQRAVPSHNQLTMCSSTVWLGFICLTHSSFLSGSFFSPSLFLSTCLQLPRESPCVTYCSNRHYNIHQIHPVWIIL